MKNEHVRASQTDMEGQEKSQTQMQKEAQKNKYEGESFRKKLLDDEDKELKEIERMMEQVKKIAIDTSQLIVGVGAKLNIASESIRDARLKMQGARKELEETNKYEEDTTIFVER